MICERNMLSHCSIPLSKELCSIQELMSRKTETGS